MTLDARNDDDDDTSRDGEDRIDGTLRRRKSLGSLIVEEKKENGNFS